MNAHQLLHTLSRRFALDAVQTRALWQLAGLHAPPPALALWLRRGLGGLAALLLGAGLVFWVAANWQAQSRGFKLGLLQAAVALPVLAAWAWPRWRAACLLLATLALGGLLAYVGQTYQTGADVWQLFATWAALALVWAVVARHDALWAAWLLIAGAALGLWSAGSMGFWLSGMGQMSLPHVLGQALPWALLLLLPWALPRLGLAAAPLRISAGLAALMAFGAWTSYGYASLFSRTPGVQYWVNLGLALAALGWLYAQRPRDVLALALGLLALNALGLGLLARAVLMSGLDVGSLLFLTLAAAASLGGSGAWLWRVQRAQAAD